MSQSVIEMTKDLVLAEIQSGMLSPEDMQSALHRTYKSLLELRSREESESSVPVRIAPSQALADWRKSITRHAIKCLECGQTLKQLSSRHLRQHNLDGRSYREKYGLPRTQPLAARETLAKRRQIASETKPWETSPAYKKAQEKKAAAAKKSGRTKGTRKR